MVRAVAWGGAIALALGTFAALTYEVAAGRYPIADRKLLLWIAGLRTPSLTTVMIGATWLASGRPLTIIMLVALAALLALHDRWGAIHLAAAGAGTGIGEAATKSLLERARPTEVVHLVQVTGYSYPSGHTLAAAALYLTMAILGARHLRGRASKALLIAGSFALIVMVGLSRVYLGVHYPSDVLSGFSLGVAWALLVSAVVDLGYSRHAEA